jgi:hypothetical protein
VREKDTEVHSGTAEIMAEMRISIPKADRRTARLRGGPRTQGAGVRDGAGVEVAVHEAPTRV